MRLRARMALTTIVVVVPVVVGVIWLDARTRSRAATQALERVTLTYMLQGERDACERAPASWGGHPMPPPDAMHRTGPPPPRPPRREGEEPTGAGLAPPILWAYDAQLRSANPAAPRIDGAPDEPLWPSTRILTLVAMPWQSGPCAFVLAEGTSNPGWVGAILPRSRIWLLPVAATILVILFAAGPVVRRLRRLSEAVRQTAAVNFTEPVPIEGNDEITEVARAFRAASNEVRRQLAAKDQREQALRDFLANTTHDVMIPLTVLQSHLTTIHEQRVAGHEVDLAVIVQAMNETHYLGALTHNLGIAAKLDAGTPQIAREPVDLGALVQRVLARHRPVARQLGVSIDGAVPDPPIEVLGDVTLLEQAVNNVVYNSLKYNRAGGNVGVTLDRIGDGQFRLRVVDDGPGIAEAELSRLVERGYRGTEARGRAPDGQGLGLAIAFRVADVLLIALRFARSEYGGLQVDFIGDERDTKPGQIA